MRQDALNIILFKMKKNFIYRGAEAVLYRVNGMLIKERIKKGYRREEIDIMKRKYPTRREYRLLMKCEGVGVNVPKVLLYDGSNMKIGIEYLGGDLLKDKLDSYSKKKREAVCVMIGKQIALMHDHNIIHGDLTTSNMILKDGKVYFLDFGLGFISDKVEDKAVDLHLLKQAFESKHYRYWEQLFRCVLEGYRESRNYGKVMERLEKVEKRGRYKRKGS
jgi:TP53 regulating kinase-like protein